MEGEKVKTDNTVPLVGNDYPAITPKISTLLSSLLWSHLHLYKVPLLDLTLLGIPRNSIHSKQKRHKRKVRMKNYLNLEIAYGKNLKMSKLREK